MKYSMLCAELLEGRVEVVKARDTSPQYMVESPPDGLSPSHQRVFRDDLSPVTDLPQSKRKAINIGASPSGFILEEDEEEEENDEELEVVDARMFRPIVQPQSSDDLPADYEPGEVLEHVPDLGAEDGGQTLDVVSGQPSLCDGPGEVSDDEGARTSENLEQVEASDGGLVLEAEVSEHQPQDADEVPHFEPDDHVVPDTEQLIDFGDEEEMETVPPGEQLDEPEEADDEFDLPPPPPEQDGDGQ